MKRKPILWLALAAGLLLTFAVVRAARQQATPPGEPASLSQPGVNTLPESTTLLATDAASTTFTYQGRLTDGGSPANGVYDFQFLLFDDPATGNQVGTTVMLEDTSVSDGLFMVELNFGDVFDGRALWLEIRVRQGSDAGGHMILAPRQALTSAPYALSLRPGAVLSGTQANPPAFRLPGETNLEDATGVLNLNNSSGDGLVVLSSNIHGVNVLHAGNAGLNVETSDGDAIAISDAGDDGLDIASAGGHGIEIGTVEDSGIYVNSAVDHGMYVNGADSNGIHLNQIAGYGVYVFSSDSDGVRVNSASGNGVYARSISAMNYGGYFSNSASGGKGLYAGAGPGSAADLVLGGNPGLITSDPDAASSDLDFRAYDDVLVRLDQDANENGFFTVYNDVGGIVFLVDESGNTSAPGTKSAVVKAGEHGYVKLYAVESTENWFEDFGTASLVAGEATVTIEPVFAATVNLEQDYHVFLTSLGDCALYVAEKTPTSFTVRGLGGATCSIDFDYRIIARRLGYEGLRLEPAALSQISEEE